TFTTALGKSFSINPQDLVVASVRAATNADALRRGDARVTAGHCDCFQKIDTIRTTFRHFIASWPIHLTEDGEAAFRITYERNVDSWINQIIASVEFGYFGSCLRET